MLDQKKFDVLNVQDDNEKVDLLQSLMGNDCLGSYSHNGTAKLISHNHNQEGGNDDR